MAQQNIDDVLRKIQKLTNMTVERGCTPAEAEHAAQKVKELLEQYQLSEFDIQTETFNETVGEEAFDTGIKTRSPWLNHMAHSISRAYDCRYYFHYKTTREADERDLPWRSDWAKKRQGSVRRCTTSYPGSCMIVTSPFRRYLYS